MKGYDKGALTFLNHPEITTDYLEDDRFASKAEMESLVTTAHLIVRDLYEVFNYVEPCDANQSMYSHRIYELFLRTATEFESNCKGILKANSYGKAVKDMNIFDYFKIAPVAKLNEYKVVFERWSPFREFAPFATWNTSTYAGLKWYQDYNEVKHNRYDNFALANLENLMNSVAGLICILHVQVGNNMSRACFEGFGSSQGNQTETSTGSFTITLPRFSDAEHYEFIWNQLKTDPNPVDKYNF